MLITDLEIVFDMLETTPQKIHYLKRRSEIEANWNYQGDELDLLGFYLRTGFCVYGSEIENVHLVLTGESKPIDDYYLCLEDSFQTSKPKPRMTRWWSDICSKIQTRAFERWTEVSVVLLSMSLQDQKRIEKEYKRLSKGVRKNWRKPNHICTITYRPQGINVDAIIVYAFRSRDADASRERAGMLAEQILQKSTSIQRLLLIARNIDAEEYPYSFLAAFN
jgi:hypothetical protein